MALPDWWISADFKQQILKFNLLRFATDRVDSINLQAIILHPFFVSVCQYELDTVRSTIWHLRVPMLELNGMSALNVLKTTLFLWTLRTKCMGRRCRTECWGDGQFSLSVPSGEEALLGSRTLSIVMSNNYCCIIWMSHGIQDKPFTCCISCSCHDTSVSINPLHSNWTSCRENH